VKNNIFVVSKAYLEAEGKGFPSPYLNIMSRNVILTAIN
jgi:hypothetical protein